MGTLFDIINENQIKLESKVIEDEITRQISNSFDFSWNGISCENIPIPKFEKEFGIGVIVGSSGSGKSTILKKCFGNEKEIIWDNAKSIASNFSSFEEASNKLGAVGLNSIPTWLKPYNVLSNGEKFRADLSKRLENYAVIDEFTSVVNREVAISCSISIEKYIRKNNLHNIVFCTCHDDILPYLNPDWVYNTDTHKFVDKECLRREKITIKFYPCEKQVWTIFKRHHYLSGDLNKSSMCFVGLYNDLPIAFCSFLPLPAKGVFNGWREHRLVVLPDFQGMGIGNKMSEMFGQAFIERGCTYYAKTSNPRMGIHRDNSSLWKPTINNHKDRKNYLDKNGNIRNCADYLINKDKIQFFANRVCYSHQYIGDGKTYPYTFKSKTQFEEDILGEQLNFLEN